MRISAARATERHAPLPALFSQSHSTEDSEPKRLPLTVSALICTRNRGEGIVPAVRSILACPYTPFELIVIDQSTNEETEKALAPFLADPRLRYVRSTEQGKGRALNQGLQLARYEIVAITDDDCEVQGTWPAGHVEAFCKHPQVAVTYGNVVATEFNAQEGFTPVYVIERDYLCRTVWQKPYARGIGANMAIRREVALKLGGFDTALGPGGTFYACEDGDFAVRCLLAGHHVYETNGSVVAHHGFRTWDEGRQLTREAFIGIGAAYIKPIKCGRLSALLPLLFEFLRYALFPSLWATVTFRKPTNWQRVISFLRGVKRGWRTPVDRATILYLPLSK